MEDETRNAELNGNRNLVQPVPWKMRLEMPFNELNGNRNPE